MAGYSRSTRRGGWSGSEMVWDSALNLIVTAARHLAPDFYAHGRPTCATDWK